MCPLIYSHILLKKLFCVNDFFKSTLKYRRNVGKQDDTAYFNNNTKEGEASSI